MIKSYNKLLNSYLLISNLIIYIYHNYQSHYEIYMIFLIYFIYKLYNHKITMFHVFYMIIKIMKGLFLYKQRLHQLFDLIDQELL
jgi:hypothetical protein